MSADDPNSTDAGGPRGRGRHQRRPRTHTPSSVASLLGSGSAAQGTSRAAARRGDRRNRSAKGGMLRALLAAIGLGRDRSDRF